MGEHLAQTVLREDTPEIGKQRLVPRLDIVADMGLLRVLLLCHARAGGIEPPLSEWKPTFRPRKPVCCRYTMPACLSIVCVERVTGIEPAPAHWRYAESRSEVLRAAITLHPHGILVFKTDRHEYLFEEIITSVHCHSVPMSSTSWVECDIPTVLHNYLIVCVDDT